MCFFLFLCVFFFQAEDGIRSGHVTGVQTCALPISLSRRERVGVRANNCRSSIEFGAPYTSPVRFNALPGGDLVGSGLADLSRGVASIEALLVSIGAPRLRRIGIEVPPEIPDPEDRLYERLAESDSDSAHSRYNALIRRLVSFERAAECASW